MRKLSVIAAALMLLSLCACYAKIAPDATTVPGSPTDATVPSTVQPDITVPLTSDPEPTVSETVATQPTVPETVPPQPTVPETVPPQPTEPRKLIVLDAGHQAKGNSEKEPIGPGSEILKNKVASGTSGVASGVNEYELTLTLSLQLEQELTARGYQVIQIRRSHDVNISNAERALIANDLGADAFLRIHINGSDNASAHGATTLCQTAENPYNAEFYSASHRLSKAIVDNLAASTGCRNLGIQETDSMSGINWCQVPVTIIEVGFMSNAEEDLKMQTEAYQQKIIQGIANGVDAYFK